MNEAKLQKFCHHYLGGATAKASAIASGYAPTAAATTGYKLLQRDDVKSELQRMANDALAKSSISPSKVLDLAESQAFFNISDAFDDSGHPLPVSEMSLAAQTSISSIDIKTDSKGSVVHKIRFTDRSASLKLLARVLGLVDEGGSTTNIQVNHLDLLSNGVNPEGQGAGCIFVLTCPDKKSQARLDKFANGRQQVVWLQDIRKDHDGFEVHGGADRIYDLRHEPSEIIHAEEAIEPAQYVIIEDDENKTKQEK